MSTTEEATINPDGSQTFEDEPPPMNDTAGGEEGTFEAVPEETGIDPAFYLLGAFILFVILFFVYSNMQKKKEESSGDDFFASLDTEKVSCFGWRWMTELDVCMDGSTVGGSFFH